jgi:amino acid transporter
MATTALRREHDLTRTTAAALEEKSKLQRHFGRFDMLFFLICTLVGLDTIGQVAAGGAQSFTWLIIMGLIFFIPYALLIAELGSAFRQEGGPYVWTRLSFGRFVGSVASLLYWVSNPIWVGGTLCITALAAYSTFFTNIETGHDFWKYLFTLVFIWFTVVAAIVSFKEGKWIPTIGAWARITILSFFTLSVVLYGIKHGLHGFGASNFGVTYITFIAVAPVLFFNYVGFELPSAAGEEMKNPAIDVPYAVFRSAIGTILLYGGPILGILLVLPISQVTGLSGFVDAIKAVFTVYGGHVAKDGTVVLTGAGQALGYVAAIAFIFAVLTSGTTWIMGADRTLAVSSFDGGGPRILGTFSRRFGTPIYVNIMSGIVSTIVMLVAFHYSGNNANNYFKAVLGLAISTTTIAYLFIYPSIIKLRYSHPEVERPYRVPGGMLGVWIVGVITTAWALLATIVLVWPGFGVGWFRTSGTADASLPSGLTRLEFEKTQVIPLVVLVAVGVLFYVLGRHTREQEVDVPPSVLEAEETITALRTSPA